MASGEYPKGFDIDTFISCIFWSPIAKYLETTEDRRLLMWALTQLNQSGGVISCDINIA